MVDLGPYNKLKRKEKTQDYAQVYDIHLPGRHCILRFCDRLYQFNEGLDVGVLDHPELPQVYATTRLRWNALTEKMGERITPSADWADFTGFGPTALDHLDLVDGFTPQINLFRKAESKWDHAFQLFSSAALWHSIQ